VKGGYLLVHHTHCDGDSDQATVGSHVCTMRMPTFERFAEEAMSVFKNGSITMVERYDFYFLIFHRYALALMIFLCYILSELWALPTMKKCTLM
jgi:hypothetical protein